MNRWQARAYTAALLAALLAIGQAGYTWGEEGHATVAAIAADGLSSDAKSKIRILLGGSTGQESARMQKVASWADDVRGWHQNWVDARQHNPKIALEDSGVEVPASFKPAAQSHEKQLARDFILALTQQHHAAGDADAVKAAFEDQRGRHFTNVPLGTSSYRLATTGIGEHDCVHSIVRCAAVLDDHPLANEVMNKEQAIRFLIHYVGDLHQPLHAGVAYWLPTSSTNSRAKKATAAQAPKAVNDLGGNSLKFENEKPSPDLHKFWDGKIVQIARDAARQNVSETNAQVKAHYHDKLRALITDPAPWRLSGVLEDEVEAWDTDSVQQSASVYTPVSTSQLKVLGSAPHLHLSGNVSVPNSYLGAANQKLVSRQLAFGGMRLAMIINSIWP